jgi:hypothetical protein
MTAMEKRHNDAARLMSPSVARNKDAIRDAFLAHMPHDGVIVEIASGSGEHVAHFAAALPRVRFSPGDPDPAARASIAAWTAHLGLPNIAPPHSADASALLWEQGFPPADGLISINMIHIAPPEAMNGLFAGAGRLLKPRARLFLYGPFMRDGAHTAPSNEAFDQSLKARDARWGVRDLDREIIPEADKNGLRPAALIAMPANNFSVVFEKS